SPARSTGRCTGCTAQPWRQDDGLRRGGPVGWRGAVDRRWSRGPSVPELGEPPGHGRAPRTDRVALFVLRGQTDDFADGGDQAEVPEAGRTLERDGQVEAVGGAAAGRERAAQPDPRR